MRKATLIRSKDLEVEKTDRSLYASGTPASYIRGISTKTVENPQMTMNIITLPPGQRTRRHYHTKGGDIVVYILKGRMRFFLGPDDDIEEFVAEAGDFVYTPQGTTHSYLNVSETEPCEYISICTGIGSKKEAEQVWLEAQVGGEGRKSK